MPLRNTGIEYRSTEKNPVVLPELSQLLPPLDGEQLSVLEADILTNGCYSPVIVNEDLVIVDGHHRQKICKEHGIPYRMLVFSFDDMLEAKQWALDTQKARRNLATWELGKIALMLKPDIEARAIANKAANGGDKKSEAAKSEFVNSQTPISKVDTTQELANAVGLGQQTMNRIMQIDEHAPPTVIEALDNKELSVNQGYNLTKKLLELPEEQREAAAIDALELEKAKKELRKADAETDRRARISTQFSKAYGLAVQLEATEDSVRAWTEFSGMSADCIRDMIRESMELAEKFQAIAELLEVLL
jgi:ParB-like chromosome segregation protein Spo0J